MSPYFCYKTRQIMKKKTILSILLLVVALSIVVLKKASKETTDENPIVTANVEALATGEGSLIKCYSIGCLVYPVNGVKVAYIKE